MMAYTTELKLAKFANGLAVEEGWAQIYRVHPETREFIEAAMDHVPAGMSIVADAYLDAPVIPTKKHTAIVRSADEKEWLYIQDFRGMTAYQKADRQHVVIKSLGEIPDTLTLKEPTSEFDVWDGKKWIQDEQAKQAFEIERAQQQKTGLLYQAEEVIALLERKVKLGMSTEDEKQKLTAWEIYSIKLTELDLTTAPDINWPQQPAE